MAPKGVVMTQFDKDSVEYVGLVKIDLLGNRALATVDEAMAWLEEIGHGAALHGCHADSHGSKEGRPILPSSYPC